MKHLPAEIWTQIVLGTGPSDWNNLRLTEKWIRDIATPIRFREVTFVISEEGIDGLERLSLVAHLARHVRKCNSGAAPHLRIFDNFQHWRDSIIFPDDPHDNDVMSSTEWKSLSTNETIAMFNEYNSERIAANNRVRCVVSRLCNTLRRFPMLVEFKYGNNAFAQERFHQHWRRLRFKPLSGRSEWQSMDDNDKDAEGLQLLCVWQALGQALPCLKMLRSMTWHVRNKALTDAIESSSHRTEKNQRLGYMGCALGAVTHLDCFVHDYDEDGWSLFMAVEPLGGLLCYARNVQRLRLRFGNIENSDLRAPCYQADDWNEEMYDLLDHLAERKPWPQIRVLELGLITDVPTLLKFLNSAASLEHWHWLV